MKRYAQTIDLFAIPVIAVVGIVGYLVLLYLVHSPHVANIIILASIAVGSFDQVRNAIASLVKRQFALDYIAILAITTGIISGEFLVADVIVLMLASGEALEKYAVARAKKSLTALTDRIPNTVLLWDGDDIGGKVKIAEVRVGQEIFVRKGEVIPLDGILVSDIGEADESSLTGEPYEIEKIKGDTIRSGTINTGKPMIISVTHAEKESTYHKIVTMVAEAQSEQSPMIRLADRYSSIFTIITLGIAGAAFLFTHNLHDVLAVLVIATPCPLILATPIALIGGMNALGRRKVIVKNLVSIETLSRVTDIMFDKTGTITLGRPRVTSVDMHTTSLKTSDILSIGEAIERNSLHPLAKAIIAKARFDKVKHAMATNVHEEVGYGITGVIGNKPYVLSKVKGASGFAIELTSRGKRLAIVHFEDQLKVESKRVLRLLKSSGLHLSIYTGDKKDSTKQILERLGAIDIDIRTDCTPEDKMRGIKRLRQRGHVTAMVGDGINDAPAIAASDVGMVFASGEQTAASEAADLVFLGGNFSLVFESLQIAKRTIAIAMQSIGFGIGLSIVGMIFAAFGFIPPLAGAILQEAIDVSVIFNALRASR